MFTWIASGLTNFGHLKALLKSFGGATWWNQAWYTQTQFAEESRGEILVPTFDVERPTLPLHSNCGMHTVSVMRLHVCQRGISWTRPGANIFLIVEDVSFWPYFESKPSISSWWPVRFSEPTSQWDGTPMGGQCSFIGTETLGGMANSGHREYRGQIPRAKWEMCGNSWLSMWGADSFLKRC